MVRLPLPSVSGVSASHSCPSAPVIFHMPSHTTSKVFAPPFSSNFSSVGETSSVGTKMGSSSLSEHPGKARAAAAHTTPHNHLKRCSFFIMIIFYKKGFPFAARSRTAKFSFGERLGECKSRNYFATNKIRRPSGGTFSGHTRTHRTGECKNRAHSGCGIVLVFNGFCRATARAARRGK